MKEARKQFSKLGLMFFVGSIVIYAVQFLTMAIVEFAKPEWLENANISMMLSVLPMYLIGMPVLILLVKKIPADTLEYRPMKAGKFVVTAIMCFALVYMSNFIGNIFTFIIGFLKGSLVQNQVMSITESVSMWMIVVYMVICAPIMEEYVFRKLIVDRTVRYGQGAAVVISGLMFGLFHGNLNQFVYAFTLGMFLAFLYMKTGNIKITIVLHMLINFVGGVVSTWVMDLLDLEEYQRVMSSADMDAMMNYAMSHIGGLVVYVLFIIFVFGMIIAGGVLFIVSMVKKKFALEKGIVEIPKGQGFKTVILNVGMIIYSIFWIAMIIYQLFV